MGEYVEIAMSDGTAQAYLAPAADGGARSPQPGVLLYMDAFGVRPQLEQMADTIAGWGYLVLVPNVFWRDGSVAELAPTVDLRDPESTGVLFAGGLRQRLDSMTPERIDTDAERWIAALREHGADGPLAAVGYCFGGRLALRTAALRPQQVALAGLFHSGGLVTDSADSPHRLAPRLRAFVLAGHADADQSNTPEQIAAFEAALAEAGVRYRSAVYPGAGHGYTMADTHRYDAAGDQRHYTELREALADL